MTYILIAATLFTLLSLYIFFFPSIYFFQYEYYHFSLLSLVLLSFLSFQLIRDKKTLYNLKVEKHKHQAIPSFFMLFLSAFTSYCLVEFLGINSVLSSSLTGLFFAFFIPKYSVLGFTGSFIGMSAFDILDFHGLLIACFFTFILWLFSERLFAGIGGKLGTMAFFGTFLAAGILPNGYSIINPNLFFGLDSYLSIHVLLIVLIACIVAWMTSWISSEFYGNNAIKGSSAMGFFIGTLSMFISVYSPFPLVAIFYGASFAGMSSISHFKNRRIWIAFSGGVTAITLLLILPYWNGLGGKLGLSAFLSVLISKFFFSLWHFLKGGFSND